MKEDGRETEEGIRDESGETIKDGGGGWGESASFNIKQHGEKFNVPFIDLFACL